MRACGISAGERVHQMRQDVPAAHGFGESTVYCSQCVSVFQKRDVVSIEQQTAKLEQIKWWERLAVSVAVWGGCFFRGAPAYLGDRVFRGLIVFAACFLLTGALGMVAAVSHDRADGRRTDRIALVGHLFGCGCRQVRIRPGTGGDMALEGTLRDFSFRQTSCSSFLCSVKPEF